MARFRWRISLYMITTWIRQRFAGANSNSVPFVMGSRWMLEMHQCDDGSCSFGLFLAAFGIIRLSTARMTASEFVGLSTPGRPPASWLTASMVFELGDIPLAETPEQLLTLVKAPLTYTCLETGIDASPLSKKAKNRIAAKYHDPITISEIALDLGVSHAHLTRQFRRDFAITPVSYRHQLRVHE